MTEQAPKQGGLGGVSYPYSKEFIDVVLEEEGKLGTYLGVLETGDQGRYERDKELLTERAGYILGLLGIEADDWRTHVATTVRKNYSGERSFSGKRLRATPDTPKTKSAAGFLHESAFWSMPMEGEVYGDGEATITFKPTDGIQLEFIGRGEYWRDRFYKHPTDGAEVTVRERGENDGSDLWMHDKEPEYLGYEDHHCITFTAVMTPAETAEVNAKAA